MGLLHRHQLAYLSPAAWQRLVARHGDADDRACITEWARRGLPVVVTRQPEPDPETGPGIWVGLSAPAEWGRRRLAFRVEWTEVLWFDEFPTLERIAALQPRAAREPWQRLGSALAACGVKAHVYGSHGWQCLSGLDHVRAGSDLDLWVAVESDAQADAVAVVLDQAPASLPRLDGELHFEDGSAVSWREWQAWRNGCTRAVLVRTLDRSFLRWSPATPAWRQAA